MTFNLSAYHNADYVVNFFEGDNKSSEVDRVTNSLIGKVDAIYVANDNTVVSAIYIVVKIMAIKQQLGLEEIEPSN